MSQGGNANISGVKLETLVSDMLKSHNIKFTAQHKFTSIYKHNARIDFYVPELDCAIECKNQNVAGSVDEKIPYVMENLEQHPAKNAILVFGGVYWKTKQGIIDWAKAKAAQSKKNIVILFYEELESHFEQAISRSPS